MKSFDLIHIVLVGMAISALLAGCSVRLLPPDQQLDGEEAEYVGETPYYGDYYGGVGVPLPPSAYDAWYMPRYYQETLRYGDYALNSAHLPPYRMNIDPNPNDEYYAGEPPLHQASPPRITTPTDAYPRGDRSTEEQENCILSRRADDRSRRGSRTVLDDTQKTNEARDKLKRRRDSDMHSETNEERKTERRMVQEGAR